MLDKNTIIGLVLIFAVVIGFGILSAPSEEERAAMKVKQDSIIRVEANIASDAKAEQIRDSVAQISNDSISNFGQDSTKFSE